MKAIEHTAVHIPSFPSSEIDQKKRSLSSTIQRVSLVALGTFGLIFCYQTLFEFSSLESRHTFPIPEVGPVAPRCLPFKERKQNLIFKNTPKMETVEQILEFDQASIKVNHMEDFSWTHLFKNRLFSREEKEYKHPFFQKLDSRRLIQILKTFLNLRPTQLENENSIKDISNVVVRELEKRLQKDMSKEYLEDYIFFGENCSYSCKCTPLNSHSEATKTITPKTEVKAILSSFKMQFI